jgi:hypothetical protein
MRQVNKELSLEEKAGAERFFERVGESDATNVRRLVGLVDIHADDYFSSRDLEDVHYHFDGREAFFAVYGIGGNVTKDGERPDVDVMIVTNMRYREGFLDGYDDRMDDPNWGRNVEPLWRRMNQELRDDMEVKREGELPDNYNLGVTRGKCIITLTPPNGARKIDVVYVKSMVAHGSPDLPEPGEEYEHPQVDGSRMHFNSEADFVSKDLGRDNEPLAKVLLYRAIVNFHRSRTF